MSGLEVEPGWVNARTGRPIDYAYLQDLKLAFHSVQEYVQGKMSDPVLINAYTIGSAMMYFKNWLVPMLRRRFDPKLRQNYVLGEDVQGYWVQGIKIIYTLLHGFIKHQVNYWPTMSQQEKSAALALSREVMVMMVSSLVISILFGFDADDEDKYDKLKNNSYAKNLALLIALQAKSETESLSLSPFFTVEKRIIPPVITEATKFIKNPFIWIGVIDDFAKMVNALRGDDPYYDQDMPAYNIEEGDYKPAHYLRKVSQWNDLIYTMGDPLITGKPVNPEGKIQVFINNIKR